MEISDFIKKHKPTIEITDIGKGKYQLFNVKVTLGGVVIADGEFAGKRKHISLAEYLQDFRNALEAAKLFPDDADQFEDYTCIGVDDFKYEEMIKSLNECRSTIPAFILKDLLKVEPEDCRRGSSE